MARIFCPHCRVELRDLAGWSEPVARHLTALLRRGYSGPFTVHCRDGEVKKSEVRELAEGVSAVQAAIVWQSDPATSQLTTTKDESGVIIRAERRVFQAA